jgi:hypothetical protein
MWCMCHPTHHSWYNHPKWMNMAKTTSHEHITWLRYILQSSPSLWNLIFCPPLRLKIHPNYFLPLGWETEFHSHVKQRVACSFINFISTRWKTFWTDFPNLIWFKFYYEYHLIFLSPCPGTPMNINSQTLQVQHLQHLSPLSGTTWSQFHPVRAHNV